MKEGMAREDREVHTCIQIGTHSLGWQFQIVVYRGVQCAVHMGNVKLARGTRSSRKPKQTGSSLYID